MTTGTLADGTGLLHAILAHPEDDAPRLVYADWLEERGQAERAELIRVQCEIVREESYPGDRWCAEAGGKLLRGVADCYKCRPCCLRRRQDELLKANYPPNHWLWAGEPLREIPSAAYTFRRGFVADVALTLADWCRHGARLVQQTPLTRVRISDREPLHHSNSVGPFAWWVDVDIDPDDDDKSDLPRDLFELLAGGHYVRNGVIYRQPRREYDTLADAHDDLSAACLLLAKRKDSAQ